MPEGHRAAEVLDAGLWEEVHQVGCLFIDANNFLKIVNNNGFL